MLYVDVCAVPAHGVWRISGVDSTTARQDIGTGIIQTPLTRTNPPHNLALAATSRPESHAPSWEAP